MPDVQVQMVKCACPDCVCVVDLSKAHTKDDRAYCGDACASHHTGGTGCGHAGCKCHG